MRPRPFCRGWSTRGYSAAKLVVASLSTRNDQSLASGALGVTDRLDELPSVEYVPPIDDIMAALDDVYLEQLGPLDGDVDREAVEMIVKEFGRFAADVIARTDRVGDQEGAHYVP